MKQEREKEMQNKHSKEMIAKYGGEEHLNPQLAEIFAVNDTYQEYNMEGNVVKRQDKVKAASRYTEDNLMNGHTTVYGSWYEHFCNI